MNRKILKIHSREILDSRGNPTVEAVVCLECGVVGVASCPSGASTGTFEAVELRDGDKRYLGKGVQKSVDNINNIISPELKGVDCSNTLLIDKILIDLDATENKSYLGANATLPVSLACARAAATSFGLPLYKFLGGTSAHILPVPMMNVINGGAHASNNLDIQEFMIVPFGADSFKQALRQCSEVYHTLGNLLKSRGLSASVGDEGGYAPSLSSDEDAISLIVEAIETSGYNTTKDFSIALDAAASEWALSDGYNLPLEWATGTSKYKLPKRLQEYTTEELITYWSDLIKKYPISSIEDGLAEDDRNGWIQLTSAVGKEIQLVGDDLYVTNSQRLRNGIRDKMGNCILIKPNQIGTLSETLETISLAQRNGYKTIISHRSGETEDTFIADLAVSINSGQIKSGAPCRSERVAKYNRLLRIESYLKSQACYGETRR